MPHIYAIMYVFVCTHILVLYLPPSIKLFFSFLTCMSTSRARSWLWWLYTTSSTYMVHLEGSYGTVFTTAWKRHLSFTRILISTRTCWARGCPFVPLFHLLSFLPVLFISLSCMQARACRSLVFAQSDDDSAEVSLTWMNDGSNGINDIKEWGTACMYS